MQRKTCPAGIFLDKETYLEGKAFAEDYMRKNAFLEESLFEQQVVEGDLDRYGHVHNIRYVALFDDARSKYNLTYAYALAGKEMGTPEPCVVADQSIRYLRPALLPDVLLVGSRFSKVDDRHFTLHSVMISYRQKKILAEASAGHRAWDMKASKPGKLSEDFIAHAKANMERQTTLLNGTAKL